MKKWTIVWVLWMLPLCLCAQETGAVTDIDGNTYPTVVIGSQEWMTENLRVMHYRDGTPILNGLSGDEWSDAGGQETGAAAIYDPARIPGLDSEADVAEAYGLLYNWFAVVDPAGLCPEGWKVPGDDQWSELTEHLIDIDDEISRRTVGQVLKSRRQEDSPLSGDDAVAEHPRWNANDSHYGTNSSGFNALPGGFRWGMGLYGSLGEQGTWWTSSESRANVWIRSLRFTNSQLNRDDGMSVGKTSGYSVRCIRAEDFD